MLVGEIIINLPKTATTIIIAERIAVLHKSIQVKFITAFVLAAWLLFMPLAHAEGNAPGDDPMSDCESGKHDTEIPRAGWLITAENDSLWGQTNSDRYYTQGLQFGYRFKPERQYRWFSQIMDTICRSVGAHSAPEDRKLVGAASVFFGQHFFTPANISTPDLIEDDRPYAAWLYVGTRLEVAERFDSSDRLFKGLYHTFEFQLGVLGPPAQGHWVQNQWHMDSPAPQPLGWHNQLKTEPGVQFRYTVRGLLADWPHPDDRWKGWRAQVIVNADFNMGTILDTAGVGGVVRIGRNLSDPISLRLGPTKAATPCISWISECYVFAGWDGHAVGFNAFLDGGMFRGGHSVDKNPFVSEYSTGFRLGWRPMQFDVAYIWRSHEFEQEPPGKHAFWSANLRCYAPVDGGMRGLYWSCPGLLVALLGYVATR